MENANSYEYLEKIKIAVIENLKRTAPVPSVQMQDVPRQGLGMSDDQDDELDDLDEDENKDVRMTQRQWEKKVQRQDEFEESDDEDMAEANGVYKPNGGRRRQITEFPNPYYTGDNMDIDSRAGTPEPRAAEPAAAAADGDDTILEDEAAAAEAGAGPAGQPEADSGKTDVDGDVDMGEADADKVTAATIKKEDVDGTSMAEAAEAAKTLVLASPTGTAKGDGEKSAPADDAEKVSAETKEGDATGSAA